MYRAAILGCPNRSRTHARAYAHVRQGEIVAICDIDPDVLNAFGNEFEIQKRYTDAHEMLEAERPDLLHIVTRPSLRVPLLRIPAEHEVPAVIVEKPIAIDSEHFLAISEMNEKSRTKFVVNHQVAFPPDPAGNAA